MGRPGYPRKPEQDWDRLFLIGLGIIGAAALVIIVLYYLCKKLNRWERRGFEDCQDCEKGNPHQHYPIPKNHRQDNHSSTTTTPSSTVDRRNYTPAYYQVIHPSAIQGQAAPLPAKHAPPSSPSTTASQNGRWNAAVDANACVIKLGMSVVLKPKDEPTGNSTSQADEGKVRDVIVLPSSQESPKKVEKLDVEKLNEAYTSDHEEFYDTVSRFGSIRKPVGVAVQTLEPVEAPKPIPRPNPLSIVPCYGIHIETPPPAKPPRSWKSSTSTPVHTLASSTCTTPLHTADADAGTELAKKVIKMLENIAPKDDVSLNPDEFGLLNATVTLAMDEKFDELSFTESNLGGYMCQNDISLQMTWVDETDRENSIREETKEEGMVVLPAGKLGDSSITKEDITATSDMDLKTDMDKDSLETGKASSSSSDSGMHDGSDADQESLASGSDGKQVNSYYEAQTLKIGEHVA